MPEHNAAMAEGWEETDGPKKHTFSLHNYHRLKAYILSNCRLKQFLMVIGFKQKLKWYWNILKLKYNIGPICITQVEYPLSEMFGF